MLKLRVGIRARILSLIMAATILPLLFMNFFWANSQRQSLLANASSTQTLVTENVANQVDNFVTRKVRALIIHSQSPSVQQFDLNRSKFELGALLFQDRDISRVALVNQSGQEVAAYTTSGADLQPSPLKDVRDTDPFRVVSYLGGKEYISPVSSDSKGHPSITVAVPMLSFTQPQDLSNLSTAESGVVRSQQDIKGALIVQVSLESLWSSVLAQASLASGLSGSYAYVVDSQGRVIAHPDAGLTNSHGDLSAVPEVALFRANIDKDNPTNRTVTALSEKNILVLGTYQKIPSTNWGVIFEVPMSSIYQNVNRSTEVGVVVAVVAVVLMLLLSLSLGQYITAPILLIAAAAKRIGGGDFATRLSLRRSDEIGELSEDINSMGKNLQEFIGRIETQGHRVEAILNNTVESILAIDEQGRVTVANSSAGKMTEQPPDGLIGKNINDLFAWRHEAAKDTTFKVDYFAPGTKVYPDLIYNSPSGTLHDVKLIVVRPTPTEALAATQAIITIHDETESRELEKMKIDFVSLAAHELRTPLTAIRGYLDLITFQGGTRLDEKIQHYVAQSRMSVVELSDLISNLLNVTRIERGTLTLTMGRIDLATSAVQSVQSLQFSAADRKIALTYVGPSNGCEIVGDEVAIREVLRNLVDNAVKYTLPGGKVDVIMRAEGDKYVIDVKDTGVGMAANALPHLFTKFYRVHGGLESGSRGTGLGLFIAKSIIERHNGTISVTSKEDVGSTFTVTLPKFDQARLDKALPTDTIRRKRGWVTKNITR